MTRMQQFNQEVKDLSTQFIRNSMPEAKILICDICFDLQNEGSTSAWSEIKIPSGLQKQFIDKSGFVICKKSEASLLMVIGEKNDCDLWMTGKYKNYWLKPKQ